MPRLARLAPLAVLGVLTCAAVPEDRGRSGTEVTVGLGGGQYGGPDVRAMGLVTYRPPRRSPAPAPPPSSR